MESAIGATLALVVGWSANRIGLDRDRAFYPVVTMVIASYYILFAVVGHGPVQALLLESAAAAVFLAAAVAGFKSCLWLVVAALVGHGVFDLLHGGLIANPGMPPWWPGFCLAYDVAAAGYLGWLLATRRTAAGPSPRARADDKATR